MSRSPETEEWVGKEGRGKYWLASDPTREDENQAARKRGEGRRATSRLASHQRAELPPRSPSSSAPMRSSRTAHRRADLVLIINRRLKWEVQKGREGMMYGAESNSESVLQSRALNWAPCCVILRSLATRGSKQDGFIQPDKFQ